MPFQMPADKSAPYEVEQLHTVMGNTHYTVISKELP